MKIRRSFSTRNTQLHGWTWFSLLQVCVTIVVFHVVAKRALVVQSFVKADEEYLVTWFLAGVDLLHVDISKVILSLMLRVVYPTYFYLTWT